MYFVTFGSCNPTQLSHLFSLVDTYYPTVLLADTVCTHSHALLLLVQLTKLVTTAHEQCAMTRGSCWKHNFCQFERGVVQKWQWSHIGDVVVILFSGSDLDIQQQQKYIFVAANSKYVALAALVRTKAVSFLLFVSDKFALHCNFQMREHLQVYLFK